ncbi:MAG: hypothetical protein RJA22_718, partial [Verrucomicrobiota bacterium]
ADWSPLVTLNLTGPTEHWLDVQPGPGRFYRAVQLPGPPSEPSTDFRLIDHQGNSRSLHYFHDDPAVRAVVVCFTGNGCPKIREMIPAIKALTNRFTSQGVLFWLVDANAADNRSNILAEAISLGISNGPPILHDPAQVVARSYGATRAPEAIAVNTANLQVFYRGAIDDRLSSNAVSTTQHYLSNALVKFLAGGVVSPSRTQPAGCDVTYRPRYPNLTYSGDIAPILISRCVRCHSPGNIAPWDMTSHAVIQDHAPAIRDSVLNGHMPPWTADPHYGVFTNDASLTPGELAKLVQWIDDGAQKGVLEPDPLATIPVVTNYPFAWPSDLGAPAGLLRIPNQSIPATGTVGYRYISVTNTLFSTNVWLRAAVVRPGNTRVVHHALLFEGDGSTMRCCLKATPTSRSAAWRASSPATCRASTPPPSRPTPASSCGPARFTPSRCTTRRPGPPRPTRLRSAFTLRPPRPPTPSRPSPPTVSRSTSRPTRGPTLPPPTSRPPAR